MWIPRDSTNCTTNIPSPISIAKGLLKTLIPNPPSTPSMLPMLICRMALGFTAPDCVMMGVWASEVYPLDKSDLILEKGSRESQRIRWAWRNWYARRGVDRMRGVLSMKPRRRPGRTNEAMVVVDTFLVCEERLAYPEEWCWR